MIGELGQLLTWALGAAGLFVGLLAGRLLGRAQGRREGRREAERDALEDMHERMERGRAAVAEGRAGGDDPAERLRRNDGAW
ncbi:hypothetical protein SAMN05216257_10911 [Meinhardsimonia xiamenensis]|uniref:Uncharacterized protein n=1 Tax=Meinhardsimonia xiamenensis TaxID=990712 RepID=A0A1G9GTS0_9RHOB|nr:hypothetical protein [Meinhardsimonia xiamenensis]PRX29970.1 hypothetical protein LV81_02836 [Meinhardsimonia xiamenensis]SDL04038.1 hypothetical protein SAMN05216257_10911 [Meinhardsimonia xiamenensis]